MNILRTLAILALLLSPWAAQAEEENPFRFAYRNLSDFTQTVYLQSLDSSAQRLEQNCGHAGERCACDFFSATGRKLGSAQKERIAFEPSGHYFRCQLRENAPGLALVALRSIRGSWSSARISVRTSLTASAILGRELNMNLLRSVYSYSCLTTFLQKYGTTTVQFDCSDPGAAHACNGDNFCLLQSRLPFYLYADNFQSNFSSKMSDNLYNGSGTGEVCGLQIAQFQCTDARGTPVKDFGLYGMQAGIWNTSVQLAPGPNSPVETYGFAAQVSPTTNQCPPGLVKRVFYRVNPVNNSSAPHSNYPANLVASQVGDPNAAPGSLYINQIPGGHCNGVNCTMPNAGVLTLSSQAYSSVGETTFCVLPASILP